MQGNCPICPAHNTFLLRAGLRAKQAGQLPRAPTYKGHLNIAVINGKCKYLKNIGLKGPELLACLGPNCTSGYAGQKCQSTSTRLHGAIYKGAVIFILATIRT
jgi:hypothetical protein